MLHNELNRRVLKALAEERAHHGHGSAADIDQRLGKCEGYLSRVLRGEIGLQLDTLSRLLAVLEVDPVDFFTRTVGTAWRPEPLLRRLERDGPSQNAELFDRLERLAKGVLAKREGPMQPSSASPDSDVAAFQAQLEEVDILRFSETAASVSPAEELVAKVLGLAESSFVPQRIELLCRTLGVMASCYRVTARFAESARCLRIALSFTSNADHGLATAQADLLIRASYTLGDLGEYKVSAELARQACDIYILHHDLKNVGKAVVDRAVMFYRVNQAEAAERAYRSGLMYLPEEAWPHRASAYHGLGWISLRRGNAVEASQLALQAAAAHQTKKGQNWLRLVWLQGEVALLSEDLVEAEQLLREAYTKFRELGSWLDAALVSIRLSKALLLAGKVAEMRQIATELLQLLKPLHKNRLVTAAIQEFTRASLAGEVTVEFLDRITEEIQKGCPHQQGTHSLD